jgi:Uma2 family endonuclease
MEVGVVSADPVDPMELDLGIALHRGLEGGLSIDDVEALEANRLYNVELLNGRLLVTPIGDIEHQHLSMLLANQLMLGLPEGLMVLTGVNVYDGSDVKFIPDVVVIDPQLAVRGGKGVGPDGLILVIEVTSASNRGTDLVDKREQYEAWKVPYLLVDRKFTPHRYTIFGDWPAWEGARAVRRP